MKNYEEFKGYRYRVVYDMASGSFTYLNFNESKAPPEPAKSAAQTETCVVQDAVSIAASNPERRGKNEVAAQSFIAPKAIRSKTCISLSKILPR
jgi:outer membrane receptor for monomeric catechols